MDIRSEIDIKRLSKYLNKRLDNGDVIEVSLGRVDAPTNKQLKLINVLPRELARQSAMRGFEGLCADDFRDLIINLFLFDYFELQPDGCVAIKQASFKYGLTKHELNRIIESVIEFFNSEYNFNLCVKETSTTPINDKEIALATKR